MGRWRGPCGRLARAAAGLGALVVLVGAIGGCSAFGGDESATTVPNGVRLVDLEPGTCFEAPANTDIRTVERVSCRDPHDAEAYAVFAIGAGADEPFPGGAEVQSLAQEGCQDRFAGYVGEAYEDSQYYFSALAPTRKSWEARGDRRVLCSVIASDGGRLEGSVRAGGRDGDG